MSRRPQGAATADPRVTGPRGHRLEAGEGRVSMRCAGRTPLDQSLPPCATWLAHHAESEQLTRRWQDLESRLIREHDWFRLGKRQQAAVREGAELLALGHRLRDLQRLSSDLLATLPGVRATTAEGLAAKLAVAAAHLRPEENPEAHELVQSILSDLRAMVRTSASPPN